MTRLPLFVFGFVVAFAIATPARAQAPSSIDVQALGLGLIQQPVSIEADGNAATQEWLITPFLSTQHRVLRVSPSTGALCLGPVFNADASWTLQRIGGVDHYTRLTWPRFEWFSLAAYVPAGCAS